MERHKYPRTYHLNFSHGASSDDKILDNHDHFIGKNVVVTTKLDGESTSFYSDGYMHARSLDSAFHSSRSYVKTNIVPMVSANLPEGWRVCGENLYAKHSIYYDNLPSFFMVYSIWNEKNEALSWKDTVEWCEILHLHHVPVLWQGVYDEQIVKNLYKKLDLEKDEGFVVRVEESFPYEKFSMSLAKFVRAGHVHSDAQHWKNHWTPNKLDRRLK